MKAIALCLLAPVLSCLLVGCGTTERTKATRLTPTGFDYQPPLGRGLEVSSAELEPGGARSFPVGVLFLKGFNDKELRVLETSLRKTVANLSVSEDSAHAGPLHLHIVIRRHLLAASNNAVAVLECVAWCATTDGKVIYDDQFFACASWWLVGGSIKKEVNRIVVQRIVQSAIYLSQFGPQSDRLPAETKGAYNSFAEATTHIPKYLANSLLPIPFEVPWPWGNPGDRIDWNQRLHLR